MKILNWLHEQSVVLSFAVFALSQPAFGCGEINTANTHLQHRLEARKEIQAKLDEALVNESNRCQRESSRVSSRTAQLAGAQSCVALQESATYNRELKDISHDCVDKIGGVKFAMEFIRETEFAPFRSSIDLVVQEDQGDSFLQRICPGQLADTAEMLSQTTDLMNHSRRSIAKAKLDGEKFAALEGKVAQFERTTQGGYDRCVAEGQILANQPVAGTGSGAPRHVPVQGSSKNEGNTITGVEQDKAKRDQQREILGF